MGHGTHPMAAARMNAFTQNKAPVIADHFVVRPECYIHGNVEVDGAPLPSGIIDFAVRLQESGTVNVTWETSSDAGIEKFIVEHRIDGSNWNPIAELPSYGNSTVGRYSMNHDCPAFGTNYYRIWQVNADGSRELSGPITLKTRNPEEFRVDIYPIPAVHHFNIIVTSDKDQSITILMYDIQGHLLGGRQEKVTAGSTKIQIPVSAIKNYRGEIIVQLRNAREVLHVTKVVVR